MPDDPPDSLALAKRALTPKSDEHYEEVMNELDKRYGKREMGVYLNNKIGSGKGPGSEG